MCEKERLEEQVWAAINRNDSISAVYIAEVLVSSYPENKSNWILYSKAFFFNGEFRRSFQILEQKELFNIKEINQFFEFLRTSSTEQLFEYLSSHSYKSSILLDLDAVLLGSRCLLSSELVEDCLALLANVFVPEEDILSNQFVLNLISLGERFHQVSSVLASLYCILGKCHDIIENKVKAVKSLEISILSNIYCMEALDYIINNFLLSDEQKHSLYYSIKRFYSNNNQILSFYKKTLLNPLSSNEMIQNNFEESCPTILIKQADLNFNLGKFHDCYKISRYLYTLDPFDNRGIIFYIASMVELDLKSELYYLCNEMMSSNPKLYLPWYCIACYYFCCKKYDLALKYLQKASKLNKRFPNSWVLQGHILSIQEESDLAISAYRTALRLTPGNFKPMLFLAKELARTNYHSLAIHLLLSALNLVPNEKSILNELGYIYLKQGKIDSAIFYFEKVISNLQIRDHENHHLSPNNSEELRKEAHIDLFCNYATALRKIGNFEESLYWFDKCLGISPQDYDIIANIAFLHHLLMNFDLAIKFYHDSLALKPDFSFCIDMLNKSMKDQEYFNEIHKKESR